MKANANIWSVLSGICVEELKNKVMHSVAFVCVYSSRFVIVLCYILGSEDCPKDALGRATGDWHKTLKTPWAGRLEVGTRQYCAVGAMSPILVNQPILKSQSERKYQVGKYNLPDNNDRYEICCQLTSLHTQKPQLTSAFITDINAELSMPRSRKLKIDNDRGP